MSYFRVLTKYIWLLVGLVATSTFIHIEAEVISKLFNTDINPDRNTSEYLQNYINLNIGKSGVLCDEITYCFRWRLRYINAQCLFWEKNLGFSFSNPRRNLGFLNVNGLSFMFQFQEGVELVPAQWYGICVSYNASDNRIVMILNNHTIMNESFASLSNLSTNKVVLDSDFKIGKCRYLDTMDPLKKIARVKLQDFNVWSTALTVKEMLMFTSSCEDPYTINDNIDIINWDSLDIKQEGSMVTDTSKVLKARLCTNSAEGTTLMIPKRQSYALSRLTCNQLGGNMIYPNSTSMLITMNSIINELNKTEHSILNRLGSNNIDNDAITNTCRYKFWMPIMQYQKSKGDQIGWWSDQKPTEQVSFMPWKVGQPNGLSEEKCVFLHLNNGTYEDNDCSERHCLLCSFQDKSHFYIRGLEGDMGNTNAIVKHNQKEIWIDRKYIFQPPIHTQAQKLTFGGYLQTEIEWIVETNEWLISDKRTENVVGYYNSTTGINPIGKHTWHLKFGNATNDEIEVDMKFTKCNPRREFTCHDGRCVNIVSRCNGIFDCVDNTDEANCHILYVDPKLYNQAYPPTSKNGNQALSVNVSMKLFAIEQIMEMDMTFKTKFALMLEWRDDRLTYYNLKEDYKSNLITMKERSYLWIPPILFNNTDDFARVDNSANALMFIRKLGANKPSSLSELDENLVYAGSENNLVFHSPYVIIQGCTFRFRNYPFDTQKCTIEVEVPHMLKDTVHLSSDGVEYLGSNVLVQFIVKKVEMVSRGWNYLSVDITLRRMISYHVVSTYAPTIILLMIGGITLFVDESHFEATIMLAITSMLVMYTLYQSVSSGLPKTAHIKMIDIWLIFGLVIPFVIFLVLIMIEMMNNNDEVDEIEDQNEDWIESSLDRISIGSEKQNGLNHIKWANKSSANITAPIKRNASMNHRENSLKKQIIKEKIKKLAKICIPTITIVFIVVYVIVAATM